MNSKKYVISLVGGPNFHRIETAITIMDTIGKCSLFLSKGYIKDHSFFSEENPDMFRYPLIYDSAKLIRDISETTTDIIIVEGDICLVSTELQKMIDIRFAISCPLDIYSLKWVEDEIHICESTWQEARDKYMRVQQFIYNFWISKGIENADMRMNMHTNPKLVAEMIKRKLKSKDDM